MIPRNLEKPFNPLIVGKIIEFSANKSAFEEKLKTLDPETVEAFTWILRWILQSELSFPEEICDWFRKDSILKKGIEEKYPNVEGMERYNLLEMIKLFFVLKSSLVQENFTFSSDHLKVDMCEMIVQGCLNWPSVQNLQDSAVKIILDNELIEILHQCEEEEVRITILRTLQNILSLLPRKNPLIELLNEKLKDFTDIRFLEALTFILKPLKLHLEEEKGCKSEYEDHIMLVIHKGLESEDWKQWKQAIHALKQLEIKSLEVILTIFNALEQNQTHLIVPAINLLSHAETIDVTWKKLLFRQILKHHQKEILLPAMNFFTESKDFNEIIDDCLSEVFSSLNHSSVHQEIPHVVEKFCTRALKWNWRRFLSRLTEETWQSIPLYSMLKHLTNNSGNLEESSPVENERDLGQVFGKIVINIFNQQVDNFTKKEIIAQLFYFLEKIKMLLKTNEIEGLLTYLQHSLSRSQLREMTSAFDGFTSTTCEGFLAVGSLTLIKHRDLQKEFNGDLKVIYKMADDISTVDLLYFFDHADETVSDKSNDFLRAELQKFHELSLKKRLVLLSLVKLDKIKLNQDLQKDFLENFEVYLNVESESRDFSQIYERRILEVILESHGDIPNERILNLISDRFDCGKDFCNTVFLFKFIHDNKTPSISAKAKVVVDLAYKEMMIYKGKSGFSPFCSFFIECFPVLIVDIEETLTRLLEDISLNASEIAESISKKLIYLSEEFFINLLATRESFNNGFVVKKSSPLKILQMKVINHVQETGISNIVLAGLVEKYAKLSKSKSMYYPNSSHHLDKLRIIQGIALLARGDRIWRREYLDFLLTEANQPSILFILEMIVTETIPSDKIYYLFELLQRPEDLKMHAAQSIFCILYLLCLKNESQDFWNQCFNVIYPWTMGQNFTCRLYAQITLVKITHLMPHPEQNHQNIHDAIMFAFRNLSGNSRKTLERLEQDFRYNHVKIQSLLSASYILRDIPRITGVIDSEIVPDCPGPNDLLYVIHPWQEKHSQSDSVVRHQETYTNIQTKIVTSLESRKKSNLIVCASLVENYPNLGGLARTCEVFGVSRLILNSLHDVENSQFLALSMSAEKWLSLEEVKKWQLLEFCVEMKRQGYKIIGAEQTSKSTNLTSVEFPEKSLIVLGHEKEGLPADIIAVLDIVVEIPQLGCVRSLNVHVTGSIFMYEYAKQHLFK